jgi:hypothetical protein
MVSETWICRAAQRIMVHKIMKSANIAAGICKNMV